MRRGKKKIEIKEDFTLWERNDIAEEELIDKMIGLEARGRNGRIASDVPWRVRRSN